MGERPGAILVVAPGWVGDVVMCQSLLRVLRERHPRVRIDVLAPEWAQPLVSRMPEVDGVLALPFGHGEFRALAQWRLARELRARGYRQAIVTRRSFKSALLPWLAGIPLRTGVLGEYRHLLINDRRHVDGASHPAAAVRLAVLGMEPGAAPALDRIPWPALRVDPGRAAELEAALGLAGPGPVVGLAPGAEFGPAKRWPLTHWGTLTARLHARGTRVRIFGAGREHGDAEAILEHAASLLGTSTADLRAAGHANLCGRTTLGDVVDLMGRCEAVVSNDSGLMHVAAATGTRVVALFGSTSPVNTPPLDRQAVVLWRRLACSPCFQRECPLGHLDCLTGIGVDEVIDALAGTGSGSDPRSTERPSNPAGPT